MTREWGVRLTFDVSASALPPDVIEKIGEGLTDFHAALGANCDGQLEAQLYVAAASAFAAVEAGNWAMSRVLRAHGHGGAMLTEAEVATWQEWERRLDDPEKLPAESHDYVSTACLHRLHDKCRLTCKYCKSACLCACHRWALAVESA